MTLKLNFIQSFFFGMKEERYLHSCRKNLFDKSFLCLLKFLLCFQIIFSSFIDGARGKEMLERKFLASATLQTVLDYLTIEGFPAEEYKVLSSWPRRDVSTYSFLFEPELALLVGLQVVSSKEKGGIKLFDKILMLGIVAYACLGGSRDSLGSDQRPSPEGPSPEG